MLCENVINCFAKLIQTESEVKHINIFFKIMFYLNQNATIETRLTHENDVPNYIALMH